VEEAVDTRLKEATATFEARIKDQEEQRIQLLETSKQTEERLTAERDEREKARLVSLFLTFPAASPLTFRSTADPSWT
jgi:hypothetical protein